MESGPVFLNFLLNRNEQTLEEQVGALEASMESVLQELGKLPTQPFSVVGVDANETRLVVELVIDGCAEKNSAAIYDAVEQLAADVNAEKKDEPKDETDTKKDESACQPEECPECFGKAKSEYPHYKFCSKYAEAERAKEEKAEEPTEAKEENKAAGKMEIIRNKSAGTKDIDAILVGDCQHLLCLTAKKAFSAADVKSTLVDNKRIELETFVSTKQYLVAQRKFEDAQVNFCATELNLRNAVSEEDKTVCELYFNNAVKALTEATGVFDALEEKRHLLETELGSLQASAQFTRSKADKARGNCGTNCPCFTSYIELEEFYMAQYEAQQGLEYFNTPPVPSDVSVPSDISEGGTQRVVLAAPNLLQTPNLRALKQSGAQPPLIVPFEHELFNFQAFSKGPELYTPVLSGNDDLYSTTIPAMATVTTTSTEVRQISADSSNEPADMGLYSTQDSAQGFQKGNSVSIPIVSTNANEEPKAGVEAC